MRAESPSTDRAAQQAPFAILAGELAALDYVVRRIRGFDTGDHLYSVASLPGREAPFQLVVGHMDTVWPLGTLEEMPVRERGGAVWPRHARHGGGLVQLVFACARCASLVSRLR